MKTIKFLILLFIVNIIILSCTPNNLGDKDILNKETLADIIADIYIIQHDRTSIDSGNRPPLNNTLNKYYTIDEEINSYELDKLYDKYNTTRFILYKTYMYYLKEADINKSKDLKDIYTLARRIIMDKSHELQLMRSHKDDKK